jgi:hypothetical protein
MKKTFLVAVSAIALFTFPSCHKLSGDGPSVTKNYSISGFTGINTELDADVNFIQDSVYKVEIYAQSNIQDRIEMPVVDGELRLQFRKFSKIGRHSRIVAYISAPSINMLRVSGSGKIVASNPVNSGSMDINVSGSGSVDLASYTGSTMYANISGSGRVAVRGGSVNNSDLRISGSGDIDMLNMAANSVATTTSGSGNTSVYAINFLNARISGSGSVYYTGNPSVTTSISGSGKLRHL